MTWSDKAWPVAFANATKQEFEGGIPSRLSQLISGGLLWKKGLCLLLQEWQCEVAATETEKIDYDSMLF